MAPTAIDRVPRCRFRARTKRRLEWRLPLHIGGKPGCSAMGAATIAEKNVRPPTMMIVPISNPTNSALGFSDIALRVVHEHLREDLLARERQVVEQFDHTVSVEDLAKLKSRLAVLEQVCGP